MPPPSVTAGCGHERLDLGLGQGPVEDVEVIHEAGEHRVAANCERPIQLLVVLPRLDGLTVTFGLVATATPSTQRVPVVPDLVTAT